MYGSGVYDIFIVLLRLKRTLAAVFFLLITSIPSPSIEGLFAQEEIKHG